MKRTLATGLMLAGLTVLPAVAQSPDRSMAGSESSTTPNTMSRSTDTDADDNDFDLGWLGLVGLAGLAGLTRKRTTHTHDHTVGHTHDHPNPM